MSMFLTPEEITTLTARKRKAQQCAQLRHMGIAFFVNACGRPVVARSAIEGSPPVEIRQQWQPAALRKAA